MTTSFRFIRTLCTRPRGMLALGLMVLFLTPLPAAAQMPPAPAAPTVIAARLGQNGDVTRFVLEMTGKVEASAFTLADPNRVVIDLPALDWDLPEDFVPAGKGHIAQFRYGLFRPGNARVVIDLARPARIDRSFVLPPDRATGANWRVVFDLSPVSAAAFRQSAGWPDAMRAAPAPSPAPVPDVTMPTFDGRHVIVVDAGHGGVDPGALGSRGTKEKDVTLAFAKVLKQRIEAAGDYEVHLTRDRDIFIELRERVAIARRHDADLFISVHADSIQKPDVRGASIYTLSEKASDSEAAALARKENAADVIAGVDLGGEADEVRNILIDLAQRETKNLSVRFAEDVVHRMDRVTTVLRNSHRFAGFRVLKAPDVPSVLIELGFLTNRDDEKNLLSADWRVKTSDAIAHAVDAYFADRIAEASQ